MPQLNKLDSCPQYPTNGDAHSNIKRQKLYDSNIVYETTQISFDDRTNCNSDSLESTKGPIAQNIFKIEKMQRPIKIDMNQNSE